VKDYVCSRQGLFHEREVPDMAFDGLQPVQADNFFVMDKGPDLPSVLQEMPGKMFPDKSRGSRDEGAHGESSPLLKIFDSHI
jgi:hypothetical protein